MQPFRRSSAAVALCIGATVAALAFGATSARADGDPASDILLFTDVFFPYSPQVSTPVARGLRQVVAAAKKKHYPIKVALIASDVDLGAVPMLMNKPQTYSKFLGAELALPLKTRLLVVMPNGFGLHHAKTKKEQAALRGITIGTSVDNLAQAASKAVRKLAAATGHRLPA